MKSIFLSFSLFLSAAIFAVYVLMSTIGCLASAFGAGEAFYCGVFCKLGVGLLTLVVVIGLYNGIKRWWG